MANKLSAFFLHIRGTEAEARTGLAQYGLLPFMINEPAEGAGPKGPTTTVRVETSRRTLMEWFDRGLKPDKEGAPGVLLNYSEE